jgi:hypothetical protein
MYVGVPPHHYSSFITELFVGHAIGLSLVLLLMLPIPTCAVFVTAANSSSRLIHQSGGGRLTA